MLEKLFQPLANRFSTIRTALDVQKRFGEVKGSYLASAVTLNLFLSLFPLLLVAIAVVGFVTSHSSTDVPARVIGNLGLTGTAAETLTSSLEHAAATKRAASIVGLLGLTWSGLGVAGAIEYALDSTWQVTGRGIKDKLRGLVWALGALIILGLSVTMTALIDLFSHSILTRVGTVAVAAGVNVLFWMWTFAVLSYKRLPPRVYLGGAILAGVGLEVVKQLAATIPRLFTGSSALYGSLGVVFGILTTLLLFGRLLVYASVLNVVRWEGSHGTVTVGIAAPRIPGEVPLEADRGGAIEPPVPGSQ